MISDGESIASCGFYLIGDSGVSPTPDLEETITLDNTDACVRVQDASGSTIDAVGWGGSDCESGDAEYEGNAFPSNPGSGESLQRKISDTQDEDSYGPAWDTDNNANDFFIQDSPNPQNSNSEPMPPVPNLPTIMLFSIGVMVLGGYIWFEKRRELTTCDS